MKFFKDYRLTDKLNDPEFLHDCRVIHPIQSIGTQLAMIRAGQGMSMKELMKKAGVSKKSANNVYFGMGDLHTLVQMADALGYYVEIKLVKQEEAE